MTTPAKEEEAGSGAAEDRVESHLSAAGEHLAANHFRQAEVELLRALSTAPTDFRALKLLALVRFKLGKLDEAHTTYREIAALQPGDATIQRNFGLVSLKLSHFDDAAAALERATRIAPDDKRAWTYYGYALTKTGDSTAAALALRRGGQDLLAAQLEPGVVALVADVDTSKVGGDAGGEPASAPRAPASTPESVQMTVLADATRALAPLPAAAPPPSVQAVPLVSFVVAGLGRGAIPVTAQSTAVAFAVQDEAYVRRAAALGWTGGVGWTPAFGRVRGRNSDGPLGGPRRGFFRVAGAGALWVAGPPGRWATVTLDDDIFYVREDRVLAFDQGVSWEAGRIPADGLRLLQFRGSGRVALQFDAPLAAVRVTPARALFVPRGRLYGWVGRIVPHGRRVSDRLFQIECEGEGIVLLAAPPAARRHRRRRRAVADASAAESR